MIARVQGRLNTLPHEPQEARRLAERSLSATALIVELVVELLVALGVASIFALTFALTFALVAPISYPQEAFASGIRHVLPDEGAANPSFASFRKRLLEAVEAKDRDFVISILSDHISFTIEKKVDKQMFLDEWNDLAPSSAFWPRLEKALTHGAQSDGEEYSAPALAFADNHSEKPQAIVFTKSASLRKAASETSPVIRRMYDEQVTLIEPREREPLSKAWVKVATDTGATGYVQAKDVFSAFDDFAVFEKAGKSWQMKWFGYAAGL